MKIQKVITPWPLEVTLIFLVGLLLIQKDLANAGAPVLTFVLVCPLIMIFMMNIQDHM